MKDAMNRTWTIQGCQHRIRHIGGEMLISIFLGREMQVNHGLKLHPDGTLELTMPKDKKVTRVLVCEAGTQNGKLYYPEPDVPDINVGDMISRQMAIEALERDEEYNADIPNRADGVRDAIITISSLPSAESEIAENLCLCKCYITDKDGLQHEVIHTGDIRRVTGWEI